MSRDDISMKNKISDEIARFWLVWGVLLGSGTKPWRSFKINEFQGKSMKINEIQWKIMIFMIFGNFRNSIARPTRVDHPRWSQEFLPLGNVRFRGVS